MHDYFNTRYPDIASLRERARARMPGFAFDYLEGGCNEEACLHRNRTAIEDVLLRGELLKTWNGCDLGVNLFGKRYSAPFGIAPIGLQGLMWPQMPEILAKAAAEMNVPFVLSTVSSSSLERVAEISEGNAWFQLYNPSDASIREHLLARVSAARYPVLVITIDVPTFGYRPRDIRNGLAMPPRMSLANVFQMLAHPRWTIATAMAGKPEMKTLKPYMPKGLLRHQLADFMNKTVMGAIDVNSLRAIREKWQGPLVIKGLLAANDVQRAIGIGADAIVISNHGGRQLDAAEAPIEPLKRIARQFGDKIKILVDSGLRSGPDIACAVACGADFAFLGRPFVYGVAALGRNGGIHTINCLTRQLEQVMTQLRCSSVADLPGCRVERSAACDGSEHV